MKQSILKDENGKFYYGWWIVLLASILCIFGYSAIVSVTGVFLLPVTTELGFPIGAFSLYISILSVTNIVVLSIVSKYFNEKNIKKIMIAAAIIGALSFLGFSFAKTLMHFYLLSIPMGFCFSCISMTPSMLLISNWFGEKLRGKAMSIFLAIMAVGTSALLSILNAVIMTQGWRMAYGILGVCLLVCIPLIALMTSWSPASKGIKRIGNMDNTVAMPDPSKIPGIMFKDAIKRPITWLAFLSATLIVLGSSAILQHGIATMVMSGYSQTFAASSISIMSIIMIFSGILIGALCDRYKLSFMAVATSLVFVLAMIGLAFMGTSPAWFYVYVVGYMLGVPAVNLITPLLMTHMFGEKETGRFIGYSNMFVSLGGVFGALIVGVMFDATGSYRTPWLVMAVVIGVAVIIRAICSSQKMKFVPGEKISEDPTESVDAGTQGA